MEISGVNAEGSRCLEEESSLHTYKKDVSQIEKVHSIAYLILKSPLLWTCASIACVSICAPSFIAASYIVLLVGGIARYHEHVPAALIHELAIVDGLIRDFLTRSNVLQFPYYNEILPGVYLGALPLSNYQHHQHFINDLKVKAILAVLEDFELDTEVFFASPVRKNEWRNLGVELCHISTPDNHMLSLEDLHKAADFIKEHENSIYIHCKAGRGRSVTALMAYLIKYHHMSYAKASAFMSNKRPIMTLSESQKQGLALFAESVLPSCVDAVCIRAGS